MDQIKLPKLPEVVVKGIVAVQSSDLKTLVDAYNIMASTVVQQQHTIDTLTEGLKSCREDISKIAKILEAIYEP